MTDQPAPQPKKKDPIIQAHVDNAQRQRDLHAKRVRESETNRIKDLKAAEAQNKARMDGDARKSQNETQLAASMKPINPKLQPKVYPRLTGALTEPLGKAVRHVGNTACFRLAWVCVTKHTARDILQRAYGLALQIGLVCTPNDKDNTLTFPNGSVIEFTWPEKPLPGPAPTPQPSTVMAKKDDGVTTPAPTDEEPDGQQIPQDSAPSPTDDDAPHDADQPPPDPTLPTTGEEPHQDAPTAVDAPAPEAPKA